MTKEIIDSTQIHLIEINDNITLFFHKDTMQIYPLKKDSDILKFLKRLKLDLNNDMFDEEDKILNEFIQNVLASAPKSLIWNSEDIISPSFSTIVLPIASECNLNCSYCFARTDGGFYFNNYDYETTPKILEYIVNNISSKDDPFCLAFFGGEPMLKFDIIKFTIEYMKTKYPKYKVNYSMTTNGTILNEEILDFIEENKICLLVSIDGPDNEYNLRLFKNGKNSIHQVLKNIELFKKRKIVVELRGTMVNTNPYICETFDFFEKIELPFSIVFAYTSENKDHQLSDYNSSTLASIKQQFSSLENYYSNKLKNKEVIHNRKIRQFVDTLRYRSIKMLPCGAGRGYFAITASGDLFSCPHFMNEKKYSIGNVFTNETIPIIPELTSVSISGVNEYNDCWAKNLCLGNCLAQKISLGRSNLTPLPENECILEKLQLEFYIKMFYYTKLYRPEYFQNEPTSLS